MSVLGENDFGAGKAMVVSSMCQRFSELRGSCDVCINGCPAGAFEAREHAIFTNGRCLNCGACVAMCVNGAINTSKQTVQETSRRLLDATLVSADIVLTCQRTIRNANVAVLDAKSELKAIEDILAASDADCVEDILAASDADCDEDIQLRLAHAKVSLAAATKEQQALTDAQTDGILYPVACLGMIPSAIWFALLNETDITPLERVGVLLAPGQCDGCPVNSKENIEAQLDNMVGLAESWTNSAVDIYASPLDLPEKPDTSLLGFLRAPDAPDRREALTGVFKGLRNAWNELGEKDNRELKILQVKRERREAHKRTLLNTSLDRPTANYKPLAKPVVVPIRYQLVDALGRNPAHARDLKLNISSTDTALCNLCAKCTKVCSTHARRLLESDKVENSRAGEHAGGQIGEQAGGQTTAAATTTPATPDVATQTSTDIKPIGVIVCEPLYCMGCQRCLEICPNNAIHMSEIDGTVFLLED